MQAQYEQLAETRKAESDANVEKMRRLEAEYMPKSEHLKEVELKLSKALADNKIKYEVELKAQLNQCRELCEKEAAVPIANLKEERKGLKNTIVSLEKQGEEFNEAINEAREEVRKQIKLQEKERRSRQLLAEHLEEANMNMSRLALLLREGEVKKNEVRARESRRMIQIIGVS